MWYSILPRDKAERLTGKPNNQVCLYVCVCTSVWVRERSMYCDINCHAQNYNSTLWNEDPISNNHHHIFIAVTVAIEDKPNTVFKPHRKHHLRWNTAIAITVSDWQCALAGNHHSGERLPFHRVGHSYSVVTNDPWYYGNSGFFPIFEESANVTFGVVYTVS